MLICMSGHPYCLQCVRGGIQAGKMELTCLGQQEEEEVVEVGEEVITHNSYIISRTEYLKMETALLHSLNIKTGEYFNYLLVDATPFENLEEPIDKNAWFNILLESAAYTGMSCDPYRPNR